MYQITLIYGDASKPAYRVDERLLAGEAKSKFSINYSRESWQQVGAAVIKLK